MTASVLPIVRLPRHIHAFDYAVPTDLAAALRVGQLVTVPFRSGTRFGIVRAISAGEQLGLKPVAAVIGYEPFVAERTIRLWETLALWYGASAGTIAGLALPPLHTRKLKGATLAPLPDPAAVPAAPIPEYRLYASETEHAAAVSASARGSALVIVPTIRDTERVFALLPESFRRHAIIWHGDLSPKEQYARWFAVRNAETPIVIGTRSAVFLPFTRLDTIVVDSEHSDHHKHWDQTPRYHAKDIAEELARIHGAALTLMSSTPSMESYARVFDGTYRIAGSSVPKTKKDLWLSPLHPDNPPRAVDMRDERRGKNYSLFSERVAAALADHAGDMFFFLNRKGFATSVGCADCGAVIRCAACALPMAYHESLRSLSCHSCNTRADMPLSCPSCGSSVVRLRGAGVELAETDIRRMLADRLRHRIIRIDGASAAPPAEADDDAPRIIIGTEAALPFVRWDKTTLIVFLDIDKEILLPEYRAVEAAWHRIRDTDFLRRPDSEFYLQTFNTEQTIFRSLAEPDRLYRIELSGRKSLAYPPYAYAVRYLFGGKNDAEARRHADAAYEMLAKFLTTEPKTATISAPMATHPPYARGAYWQMILLRLPVERWRRDMIAANSCIAGEVKIDPNPLSILSP
jgi:primosomal protein N'